MKFKNFISYLKYNFKFKKLEIFSLLINLVFLIFALISFYNNIISKSYLYLILIFPSLDICWQCFGLYTNFRYFFLKKRPEIKDELNIDYNNFFDTTGNYEIFPVNKATVSYDKNICQILQTKKINCKIDRQGKKKTNSYIRINYDNLFPFLYTHYQDAKRSGKCFTNDKKLCLVGEISPNSVARFCQGSYYNTYLTNKIFTKKLINDKVPDIYPPYGSQNKKVKLPYEYFSNEIGVSTLAITNDGYLFIQRQGTHADSSSGLLVPSGSGSADWKDYHNDDTLNDTINRATKRELSEEIGRGSKNADEIILKSKVIGMFRWLNYAGKPEFVSISLLKLNLTDIRPLKSEQRETLSEDDSFQIINSDETINHDKLSTCFAIMNRDECSIPLYMNLKILKEYIENNKNEFYDFIKRT